jgi:ribosomal protein L37AE/L43A
MAEVRECKLCSTCGSIALQRRVRIGGYRCQNCGAITEKPVIAKCEFNKNNYPLLHTLEVVA